MNVNNVVVFFGTHPKTVRVQVKPFYWFRLLNQHIFGFIEKQIFWFFFFNSFLPNQKYTKNSFEYNFLNQHKVSCLSWKTHYEFRSKWNCLKKKWVALWFWHVFWSIVVKTMELILFDCYPAAWRSRQISKRTNNQPFLKQRWKTKCVQK